MLLLLWLRVLHCSPESVFARSLMIPIACIPPEQVHYAIDFWLAKPQIFREFNKHPIHRSGHGGCVARKPLASASCGTV